MKRIDDKISEIKKSHNKYRMLFIAFVILIMAMIVTVFIYERKLAEINEDLKTSYADLEVEKKNVDSTVSELARINKELEETNDALTKSLRPEEYWDIVKTENTAQAYILYLTKEFGVEKQNEQEAIDNIKKPGVKKKEGWLYIGKITNGQFNPVYARVNWRKDAEEIEQNTIPKKDDVIGIIGSSNRNTYSNSSLTNKKGTGWRLGTNAFVTDVKQDGIMVMVKIIYY